MLNFAYKLNCWSLPPSPDDLFETKVPREEMDPPRTTPILVSVTQLN